jgi:hypothetical protein
LHRLTLHSIAEQLISLGFTSFGRPHLFGHLSTIAFHLRDTTFGRRRRGFRDAQTFRKETRLLPSLTQTGSHFATKGNFPLHGTSLFLVSPRPEFHMIPVIAYSDTRSPELYPQRRELGTEPGHLGLYFSRPTFRRKELNPETRGILLSPSEAELKRTNTFSVTRFEN